MLKHVVVDRETGEVIRAEDVPSDVDLEEMLAQQLHDCPECREALARGERPTFVGPEQIAAEEARRNPFARKPRWRNLKKRR